MTNHHEWTRQRIRELEGKLMPTLLCEMRNLPIDSHAYEIKFDRYMEYRVELRKKKIELYKERFEFH